MISYIVYDNLKLSVF